MSASARRWAALGAVVAFAAAVLCLLAGIWTTDLRWVYTAGVMLLLTAVFGGFAAPPRSAPARTPLFTSSTTTRSTASDPAGGGRQLRPDSDLESRP